MNTDEKNLWDNVVTTLINNNKPYKLEQDDEGNININTQTLEAVIYCANNVIVGRRNFEERLEEVAKQVAQQEQADDNSEE